MRHLVGRTLVALLVLLISTTGSEFLLRPVSATPVGTLLADLGPISTLPEGAPSIFAGLAFDGAYLYFPLNQSLGFIRKLTTGGVLVADIPLLECPSAGAGITAISYDSSRDLFWGAGQEYDVWKITKAGSCSLQFSVLGKLPGQCDNASTVGHNFCDNDVSGINYDRTDDSIWYNPGSTQRVYHYSIMGSLLGSFDVNDPPNEIQCPGFLGLTGIAVGAVDLVYLSTRGCASVFLYQKNGTRIGEFSAPLTRARDLECDSVTFAGMGTDAVWVYDGPFEDAPQTIRIKAFAVAQGTCANGGGPSCAQCLISLNKYFTDPDLNLLPTDREGNPKVDVVLSNARVRTTVPGQVLAWVAIMNVGTVPLRSLRVDESLPVDWSLDPPWLQARAAIHVYFQYADGRTAEITNGTSVRTSGDNPETVSISVADLSQTVSGKSLDPGEKVLFSAKTNYDLKRNFIPPGDFPIPYTDTAVASGWVDPFFEASEASGRTSSFFIAYARVTGRVAGNVDA